MDMITFGVLIGLGIILISFNKLVVWKVWPKWVSKDLNVQKKVITSVIAIDPLVATIVCPLTSDIFFTMKWAGSCELFFVFSITAVSLLMYTSSLLVAYRMTAGMYISTKLNSSEKSNILLNNTPALSFGLSVTVNVMLTWIMLMIMPDQQLNDETENCWPSLLRRYVFFIFVLCFSLQVIHVIFYGQLSKSVCKSNVIYAHHISASDIDDSFMQQEDIDKDSTVAYTLMTIFCLFMANVLRFSYIICSCHSYLLLAASLSYTSWLIMIKLPIAGVLFWVISRCKRRH